MSDWVTAFEGLVIVYFFLINLFYVYLMTVAVISIFRRAKIMKTQRVDLILSAEGLPHFSIVVPAYNESSGIVSSVQSLLNIHYPNFTVIVINDGSTDNTLDILKSHFKLSRFHLSYLPEITTKPIRETYRSQINDSLIVLDKENGGKADAANAGLNVVDGDYVLLMDADTLIDKEELNKLIRYSFTQPQIQGFGASVRVVNGCKVTKKGIESYRLPKSYLGNIQAVEYLRAFYFGRCGFEWIGGPLIISGAFGIFRKSILKEVGGYWPQAIGEDMELVVRIKKHLYENKLNPKIGFLPEPASWTEVPEDWKTLKNQRIRWHMGLMQIMWRHKKMLLNPRYGTAGLISFSYFFFAELLSPFIEVFGYIMLIFALFGGFGSILYPILFFCMTVGVTLLFNLICCFIEIVIFKKYNTFRDLFRMILYSFLENFGYRQITLYWKIVANYKIFHNPWSTYKEMKKKGFQSN